MINKSIFLVLLPLVLIGSVFAYYKYKEAKEAELSSSIGTSNYQLPLITIENQSEDDAIKMTRLLFGKTAVNILDNKEAAEKANSYIDRFILDQKESFYRNVSADSESTSSIQNALNVFSLTPEIIQVTPKIFIIKFTHSALYAHRSKDDQLINYVMFDIDNGKPITYNDLFPKADSIIRIKEYFQTNKNSVSETEVDEILKSLKLNNHIYLSELGLTIVIDSIGSNQSEIYSNEVVLPISILENDIDQNLKEAFLTKKEYIRMSEPETAL